MTKEVLYSHLCLSSYLCLNAKNKIPNPKISMLYQALLTIQRLVSSHNNTSIDTNDDVFVERINLEFLSNILLHSVTTELLVLHPY